MGLAVAAAGRYRHLTDLESPLIESELVQSVRTPLQVEAWCQEMRPFADFFAVGHAVWIPHRV